MSAFSSFTSLCKKRKDLLGSHGVEIPSPGDTKWYLRSHNVSVISERYESLLEIRERITGIPHSPDDARLSQ